ADHRQEDEQDLDVHEGGTAREDAPVDGEGEGNPRDGGEHHAHELVGCEAAQAGPAGLPGEGIFGLAGDHLPAGGGEQADEPGHEAEDVQKFPDGVHAGSLAPARPSPQSVRAMLSSARSRAATRASLSRMRARWTPTTRLCRMRACRSRKASSGSSITRRSRSAAWRT